MTRDIVHWLREELFNRVPVAICVIDRQFRVIEANTLFSESYGEWQGKLCHEVYKGRTERCVNCGAAETFTDGQLREREEVGTNRNGTKTNYIVRLFPLTQENGDISHVIEMSSDITRIKKLEQEKLEAERLATVGQTVAGLAHGIKNLIMGLEGGMYVVNSGLRRNNKERLLQGWAMLEEDIARISSFAREFLDFARGRTPEVQIVQPNIIARDIMDRYAKRAARSGVELTAELDPDLPEVPMDREAIQVCLTNLVLNAIDACVMSTNNDCSVVLKTYERDGVISFEVTDDGCGMDYEIKQKVFTSFFSTKASGKGTGLGLLTTRKIVQEHGGRVDFSSTEGQGSIFRMDFPLTNLPNPNQED
ncbi:MAG: PAS domain-containing protein [Proteobacteria bacterium]|jgi:PAS domain S-box-containing protein|nr:PAS domain-containing protein [Pseudomonadota bacterium]